MEAPNEPTHPLVPLSVHFVEAYRFFRSRGWGAVSAMHMASMERRIRADAGLRIRWEPDHDFSVCPDWDNEVQDTIARLVKSGKATPMGMILERCRTCSECCHTDWDQVDALWGIVIPVDDEEDTKREYEGGLEI